MQTTVDDDGRLILPSAEAAKYGLAPGVSVRLDAGPDGLRLRRPVSHMVKLYIEPTNCCNLACRTCVRNLWDEPLGHMSPATFEGIMAGLRQAAASPGGARPAVFFGGLGEPLAHPQIAEMVSSVRSVAGQVELITNGILLDETMSRRLIAAGLDRLWVSLDGARPESFSDVRIGAELSKVTANLARFRSLRPALHPPLPEIGVAFVAMRRNIGDLPDVIRLGAQLGSTRFLVTNVLPYTAELCKETLYERSLTDLSYLQSPWVPQVSLPKIDIDLRTRTAIYEVLRGQRNISFAGGNFGLTNDRCPFIEAGAGAIGWNGDLSPCLPLLHTHTSYLNHRQRISRRYVAGNISERSLGDLWQTAGHLAFRERVQRYEFAPCTFCGGCDLSLANEEDCYGNAFPTCGGCLWGQGLIRCP
jgi:MoaA/NifB/PqqE/SkfB family radical SAM enzyme